jgi:hypothetical protein
MGDLINAKYAFEAKKNIDTWHKVSESGNRLRGSILIDVMESLDRKILAELGLTPEDLDNKNG